MSFATGFMVRPKNDGVVRGVRQQVWYVTDGTVDLTVNCARGQFFTMMRELFNRRGILTVADETVALFDPENGRWMRELVSEN